MMSSLMKPRVYVDGRLVTEEEAMERLADAWNIINDLKAENSRLKEELSHESFAAEWLRGG